MEEKPMQKKPNLQLQKDTIRTHLSDDELLCQFAEEATELAQAALKYRRAITGTNPTPVTIREAHSELLKELADLKNCIDVLNLDSSVNRAQMEYVRAEKMRRWVKRLEEK
jgi:NTP pyrophosphatase (non-canonical NTP hydrolase)